VSKRFIYLWLFFFISTALSIVVNAQPMANPCTSISGAAMNSNHSVSATHEKMQLSMVNLAHKDHDQGSTTSHCKDCSGPLHPCCAPAALTGSLQAQAIGLNGGSDAPIGCSALAIPTTSIDRLDRPPKSAALS
jgi:hypothetical protein